ncbi:MAG TPA: Gfo/Idh/MocA family oxidoreductase, partial [Bacteroidales bacterium]|nr:Gfo/Idh/MocA family oxidoreductase [Bacteroidales bacterium]
MKRICVIGGGKWGQNHIRTLFEMGNLGGIVESNPKRLKELLEKYPVKGFQDVEAAVKENFDGFTIAAPAPLHYEIAKLLIQNRKNVLVEKPMTLSSETSLELVELAKAKGVRLMVGHVLLFHPAIRKIKEVIDDGKIGELYYIYSNRLNLGTVRTEENVFWSFAPHDVSV